MSLYAPTYISTTEVKPRYQFIRNRRLVMAGWKMKKTFDITVKADSQIIKKIWVAA
jgi:hypothetical protein